MRERIKSTATTLLIEHGYRGFRFADIADRLGITRANVHYHFGTKDRLVGEVLDDYLDGSLGNFRSIWLDGERSLDDRIRAALAFNRGRFRRFNRRRGRVRPWSLIARMRLESALLGPVARRGLEDFGDRLHAMITTAVNEAVRCNELRADAPVAEISLLIASIVNSSAAITLDTGSFDELERLYLGVARLIRHAYGEHPPDDPGLEPAPYSVVRDA